MASSRSIRCAIGRIALYYQTIFPWTRRAPCSALVSPVSLCLQRVELFEVERLLAFHSVDKCELQPGQWFAAVGCGGLGQFAVQYAKAMGAKVIGLDVNDDTLELVKQKGADVVINTAKNPGYVEQIKEITKDDSNVKGGCHAAAVYSAVIPAYETAKKILKVKGLLMVIGLPNKPVEFPTWDIVTNRYIIKGSNTGTPAQMKKAVEFTAKHQIIPEVDFKKLEDMPQMYKDLHEGKAPKRMVVLF